jgi:anti-sigma factor RsiW
MKAEEAATLLNAYVDGELDAATCMALEAQLAENPSLRALCERLRGLGAAIRAQAHYHSAPGRLGAALGSRMPGEPSTRVRSWRPDWGHLGAFLAGAALVAATVAVVSLRPGDEGRVGSEVLASHVRATLGDRLVDVASADQHTVKPWLSGRLNFSPPVADFSGQGFELLGGRVDYVDGQPVAVLVYQRRQHRIDAFIWPSSGESALRTSAARGFNIDHFARGGMAYWIVSDLNANELADLARLLPSGG